MARTECMGFRRELVSVLAGRPQPVELRNLSWHEHLLGCGACRDLLEREEALELLLATLPKPQLPPDLIRRVMLRLSEQAGVEASNSGLDSLLELDGANAPAGLADRVRAGIAGELGLDRVLDQWPTPKAQVGLAGRMAQGARADSQAELDVLLDRNTVPAMPAQLPQRILDGLESNRERQIPRLRLLARVPRFAAAAALLLGLLSAPMWLSDSNSTQTQRQEVASANIPNLPSPDEVDPSLLAMLDVLEDEDLWQDSEINAEFFSGGGDDILLLLDEEIGVEDEMLLAYLSDEDLSSFDTPTDGEASR